ncbi:hypothetical protein ACS0TY_008968 [Phlomoides rotata]
MFSGDKPVCRRKRPFQAKISGTMPEIDLDTLKGGTKSCGWFNHHWECLLKGLEFGNPELFITDVFGKYPRIWTLKGAGSNDVRKWYKFGALASICTIAPSF